MGSSEGDKKVFERKLNGYRFIGKNLVHIFASQGKIYTSLEFDETELKGSIATTETWALAMDFVPISSHGYLSSANRLRARKFCSSWR